MNQLSLAEVLCRCIRRLHTKDVVIGDATISHTEKVLLGVEFWQTTEKRFMGCRKIVRLEMNLA